MGLGFRMVEPLYPPDQPLDGGDPIENLTSNLKREFQFMIVSYDTIVVNRFRGVFPNLKSTRERVSTPTCVGDATAGKNLPPAPTPASPAPSSRNSPHP